jgi:Lon protease-like protein
MNEDQEALAEFNGITRLFPLPGLVLFPHAVQPLHIFEARYREMTAEAIESDRLIALVLLRNGWEEQYDQRPPVHSVACLGRIVADQLMPDGRYNLVLRGIARIRIVEELPVNKPFRVVQSEIIVETVSDDVEELMTLRTALADMILPRITNGPVREQVQGLFHGELPLGRVCDLLAFGLPLPPESKQFLLEIPDVPDRARGLMEAFSAVVGGQSKPIPGAPGKRFPPDFSPN